MAGIENRLVRLAADDDVAEGDGLRILVVLTVEVVDVEDELERPARLHELVRKQVGVVAAAIGIAGGNLVAQGCHAGLQSLLRRGSVLDIHIEVASVRAALDGIELDGGGLEGVSRLGFQGEGNGVACGLTRDARLGSQLHEGGIVGDGGVARVGIAGGHHAGGHEVGAQGKGRREVVISACGHGLSTEVILIAQRPGDVHVVGQQGEGELR